MVYDLDSIELDRETFKNRPRTVGRYHELLPISDSTKRVGLGACYAILHRCDRLAEAYRTLPQKVSLTHLTENVRYASALTYGMVIQDVLLIGRSINDLIVEHVKAKPAHGYDTVKNKVLKHGAVGACLCCAGPSLAALFDLRKHSAKPILMALKEGFDSVDIGIETIFTTPGGGIQIV